MKKKIKGLIPEIICAVVLIMAAVFLLQDDTWTFLTWWLMALLMGMIAMPVSGQLFRSFEDKGWLFSKVLAIAVTGFLTWFLVAGKVLKFTNASCVGVSVICGVGCIILLYRQTQKEIECYPTGKMKLIIREELLFLLVFLLWTYLVGFRPQAYGTEKFMDYGFMQAMMRSDVLPAKDIWYSQGTINYYYGGQYFAVFLTRLTGSRVEVTYNLMRTFVAAMAFVLPFSLIRQMLGDRIKTKNTGRNKYFPTVAGVTAGVAVSIAGNGYFIVYRCLLPLINKLRGITTEVSYWFPNATRYIGYRPVNENDKTISEFPSYSFILGDLHAHVVNVMFVLLVIGLLYAWMKETLRKDRRELTERMKAEQGDTSEQLRSDVSWKKHLLSPHLILVSILLGMFQWSNYWDFVIYFVVTGAVVLFANIIQLKGKAVKVIKITFLQAVEVIVISYLVVLPFTIKFETMVQGVALAQYHSMLYQLAVIWGLPVMITLLLIITVLTEVLKKKEKTSFHRFLAGIAIPDLFAVLAGLCAIGLVFLPEVVYVRDIYEQGYARANTMFKLTYQAYILFGLVMGYAIYRLLLISRQKVLQILAGLGLLLLIWTVGYFGDAVYSWFGEVWNPSEYQGLDAEGYLETDFSEDAQAIYWLKDNVEGSPVVLEANGDSYTGYERVSASTGLPTVLGWYVHEQLWRNDVEDLNQKSADIQNIYTWNSEELVRNLLEHYDVSYIFVGSKEREKYGDALNNTVLKSMGTVVFEDEETGTYIVAVHSAD
nr:DUF2298 domain-containing protein [uncultured Mediterraneibacter sp.]